MLRTTFCRCATQMNLTQLRTLFGQSGKLPLRNAIQSKMSDRSHLVVRRGFCSKLEESRLQPEKVSETQTAHPKTIKTNFRMSELRPSSFDKKILLWSGRFKKEEDIPEMISFEMLDAARNRIRVKVSYIMIIFTVLGCAVMIASGRKAAAKHESVTASNLERKAQLKREAEREHAAAVKAE
ncbi:protein FAM162A-like isoform X2 [Protopterus annectens]|uniref:protein FAM162A-like isoform X2 n=1 Tax=Protopterus annectens TaxID=7888 RepID=UPI001CFB2209|nr:protein FAM162A-like isoform X2 [Protopterus annectens]